MADQIVKAVKIKVEQDGTVTFKTLKGDIIATNVEAEKLNDTFKRASDNSKNLNKSMQGVSAATGGATATILEAGRAVSDMNYGIRGMANNLSQLATNMVFTTRAAGGLAGGLKAIWNALLGPVGLILAVNALLALWERQEIQAQKTTKTLESTTDAMAKATGGAKANIVALETYAKVVRESEEGTKKYNNALKELTDEGYDPATMALDDFIEKQKELIILEATAGVFKKQLSELISIQAEATNELGEANREWTEALDEVNKKEGQYTKIQELVAEGRKGNVRDIQGETTALRALEGARDNASASEERVRQVQEARITIGGKIDKLSEDYAKTLERLLELTNNETEAGRARNRMYKTTLLDLSKIIQGYNRQEQLLWEENEEKKNEIRERFEKEDLERRRDVFVEKHRQRLNDFLASNATEAQKLEAKKRFNDMRLQADTEYQEALTALVQFQSARRFEDALKRTREYSELLKKAVESGQIIDIEGRIALDSGVDALNQQNDLLAAQHQNKIYWINQEIEERKRAGRAYLDLEVQKTNVTKQMETDRLLLSRETESAKADIVLQGLDVVKQVATEGGAVYKAAGVAGATISTYEAATAALGAKPYGPWNIAQAAIVTAQGLLNVKKILSTPTYGNKQVSGGGAGGGRTFDFNLVGSTRENQLANAIGSQFDGPLRAYVVGQEITNQQELDLQIESEASLGG